MFNLLYPILEKCKLKYTEENVALIVKALVRIKDVYTDDDEILELIQDDLKKQKN